MALLHLLSAVAFSQRVGIGTTSPHTSAQLEITSTTRGLLIPRMSSGERAGIASPAQGLQVYDTDTNSFWYYNGSGWIELTVGGSGTNYWAIDGSSNIYNTNGGKISVGTTAIGPGSLNIKSNLNAVGLFMSESGTTLTDFLFSGIYTGGGTTSTRFGQLLANLGGGFQIGNQSNAPLMFQAYNAERMRITPAGYVGINTSTPTSQLEVKTVTGFAGITHTDGNIRLSTLLNSASSAAFGTSSNHPLFFYTNNTFPPAMTISTASNVGVGGSLATEKFETFTADNNHGIVHSAAGISVGTYIGGGGGWVGTKTNHPLYLYAFNRAGTDNMIAILPNGKVGVGTSGPSEKLTILTPTNNYGLNHTDGNVQMVSFVGGSTITAGWMGTKSNHPLGFFTNGTGSAMMILQNGSVGISTITPTSRLHIVANSSTAYAQLFLEESDNDYARLNFKTTNAVNSGNNFWTIATYNANTRSSEKMNFYNNATGDLMTITGEGNVGIGTTNPTYKLSVNGNIRSKEVIVETGWADYVFDEKYKLAPLQEVEKFIQQNNHLPNIPSAKEVEEKGLSVGDMQKRMMEKIEELTLYVIEQQKEIEKLKSAQNKN